MTRISPSSTAARIKALDLFAGTGWGVACQRLGIKEAGVEIMPEAVATREANGMETIYRDVWDGLKLTAEQHREQYGSYGLLIASPPCQTFSLAGKGSGRAALNEVLEAIELHAYKDAEALRAFGEKHDPRTALVLTPLAYVWRDRPRLVAMEQVPTVLPVWEACAEVMREWGYEVKVEILNAEQYGVPQTRKRAILVARRGGPVHLPVATHSKYYSTNPSKLDPGVKKWVSMAEALGWGATDQPSHTVTAGVHGPTDRWASGGSSVRKALDAKIGTEVWIEKPDPDVDGRTTYAQRFDVEDVAAIQTFPTSLRPEIEGWKWKDAPATTIAGDPRITAREHHYHGEQSKTSLRLNLDEAAILQSYPTFRGLTNKPSPTIVGTSGNGGPQPLMKFRTRCTSDPAWVGGSDPLSVEEAAELQSYPSLHAFPPFVFCGTKTKQFLQIGNAVPPLLAEHILAALIGLRPGR